MFSIHRSQHEEPVGCRAGGHGVLRSATASTGVDEVRLRLTARLPVPAAGAASTQPSARHSACLRTPRARPQVRQPQIR
jgi:hypothetical protein